MSSSNKKIFVLDTNVILHDSTCIHQFGEHDIVVPITVLEELDNFKKGNDSLNFHAREFSRTLDSLSGDKLFNGGVAIGHGLGKISIKLDPSFDESIAANFSSEKPDHHILNIGYQVAKEFSDRVVCLVTKDVNLRMKAKAVGLLAQDYKNDHVSDVQQLYTGTRIVEEVDPELITKMYMPPYEFPSGELKIEPPLLPNEYLILRGERKSALAVYDDELNLIKHVDKVPAFGITPRNAEQTYALDAILDENVHLVSLTGKAGTGKTLIALAGALKRKKSYRQILMARPIVALSNKDIGFLPGDIHSKLDPYMKPLFDNLGVIEHAQGDIKRNQVSKLVEDRKLVIEPLSYIRGRSLVNTFFIVDEAQNLTPHEIKTIITRAGEGTKIVFTGDIFQIDHPYLDSHSNGLSYLIEKMKGQRLYAHVNLTKGERSELADLAGSLL
ncbi:PhoH family protein [Pontiella sulfatireligans]|uniref:PhoH-like protein n=1 Tax=Pontiella sulfatireligans TaxID=2750658 RepID=A0A6C2UJ75_9BACT|nr:PhoH family protein [Pontiella sulfatireligans]VGO20158.1 PhoH-like protein [Pontiella sulfatireligans]